MRRLLFSLLMFCMFCRLGRRPRPVVQGRRLARTTRRFQRRPSRRPAALPTACRRRFTALVDNSNRHLPKAVDQRCRSGIARHLADPKPALAFFQSPLGKKIVAAELLATRRDQLAKNAKGLPKMQASDSRSLIIGHLASALPAREAGAEVSLAIAGVAADSLSSMIPCLLGGRSGAEAC